MDLSVFNKYREYQSETEKQFTQELRSDNHEDPDIHLIGESVPVPSLNEAVSGTPAIGTSPIPAREDHTHGLDVSALPFSLSATGVGIGVSSAGVADTVSRGDHVHALPEPLTRARFGITNDGSSLAPAVYFTSEPFLGFYRVAGGIQFTDGGVGTLFLGNPIATTLDILTYGSIRSYSFPGRYVGFLGGIYLEENSINECQEITSTSGDMNIYTPSGSAVFNDDIEYVGPPTGAYFNVTWDATDSVFYVNTSKRELKDKIKSVTEELSSSIIDGLNPVSFVYKQLRGAKAHTINNLNYGFVAEEVADVDKNISLWDWDRDAEGAPLEPKKLVPASYSETSILAVAVAEIKSLRKRVQDLEDKLNGKKPLDA